jgi:hypothetical protein
MDKGIGMRLRAIPLLVASLACIAALGAWADRPRVQVERAPRVARTQEPWDAVVEISRRGRRLDGFRPVFEVSDPGGKTIHVQARGEGEGRYEVSLVFPSTGIYTYELVVADRVAGRGMVYVPR